MSDIMVSIICNTYNQQKYIADALESFVMQKTSFKYEVLVHDDASTDNTPDIIREYEEKYPEIIKPYFQVENQYSKGIGISNNFQYPRVQGEYVAFCEGDDYWVDPYKLQKQYDILEKYTEVDMCVHGAIAVNSESKKKLYNITPSKISRIMPPEEIIMGEGIYVAANSMMYRRKLLENIPEFRRQFRYQYALKIHGSLRGGVYYIADVMSHYRVSATGSWTRNMTQNKEKWIGLQERKNNMFMLLDEYTNYKYTEVIKERIEKNRYLLLLQLGKYKEALNKKYSIHFNDLSLRMKTSVFLRARLPWVIYIRNLIKRIK